MDNSLLLIVLFMMMGRNQGSSASNVSSLNNFANTIQLDSKSTLEKIKIARKIGPYFPENYIPLINKSISLVEKFIKLNETLEFMKSDEEQYILKHIPVDNNKDRFNKIVSTIQKDSPRSGANKNGMIFDLILNIDKYQKIFEVLNKMGNSGNNTNDPSQLINLIGPLMGGDMKENSAKYKEMARMMKIMNTLDTPKKKPI